MRSNVSVLDPLTAASMDEHEVIIRILKSNNSSVDARGCSDDIRMSSEMSGVGMVKQCVHVPRYTSDSGLA